jgi:hypothetical protein
MARSRELKTVSQGTLYLWDPSTDLELEKLLTARDKLKTCIDEIRNECRERKGPSEKLNELKTRRTKHRREVMDQARNCTNKLQYIFSEGFESVSLTESCSS